MLLSLCLPVSLLLLSSQELFVPVVAASASGGRFTSRCGPCLWGSWISSGGLERLKLGAPFRLGLSQPPPLPWRLAVVNASASFLQCSGPSRQVEGRNASQPVIKQPVATLLLFQAASTAVARLSCITLLPSSPALTSFVYARLVGTTGAEISSQSA